MALADLSKGPVTPAVLARSLAWAKAAIAFVAVASLLAPLAYVRMFTGFHAYDDEGIFLVALRDYLAGHPLMTPYVPLYGPFYFEVYGGLFKLLGVTPTHDSGRWITLVVWLAASVAGGLAVWSLTRNRWLALGGQLVTFTGLGALTNEPTSTYGLSSLLLLALPGIAAVRSTRPRAAAAVIGAIVAALVLIKVNVGIFAAIAVAFAWAGAWAPEQRRVLFPPLAVLLTVFPILLGSSLWHEAWVVEFAVVVALSCAALGVVSVVSTERISSPPGLRWMLAGLLATVIACLGVALIGGSQPADIFNFLIVFPARFPQVFTVPLEIGPFEGAWAAVMLIAAAALSVWRAKVELPAATRIAAGIFTWLSVLLVPSSVFLLALPLAWLASRPPRVHVDTPIDGFCRLLIPALALLESLQAYPVAGTQISLAAIGLMPVGAIVLCDGLRQARAGAAWVAPSAVALNVLAIGVFGLAAVSAFNRSEPLGLRGAQSVKVETRQASALRNTVDSIAAHGCKYLITYPGMDSFYIWTDEESSLQTRYGQWYLILDAAKQQALVEELRNQTGVCVVKDQALINFWTRGRSSPSGPLVDFINATFASTGSYGDYELLVRASP